MTELVDRLNGLIWSDWLIYLCLGAGCYFSIRTRFLQVRAVREMLRLLFAGKSSDAGISSFQALAVALAGRVGVGNIAGVATAIHYGGPGAVFWMWITAFMGAATAFVESTLGQIYKEKDDQGRYRGGPAYYIEKALGRRWYATSFALATILGAGLLLPGIQANAIAASAEKAWGLPPSVSGGVLVVLFATIVFGGITRIARFTEFVVPIMAFGYIAMSLTLIALHLERLPEVLRTIISSAFGTHAGFGAILGLAVQWGVKRGIYSNEAGQGTGPHAASAAEVGHPAAQGLVQAFSVYVDTLLVCSATAFMLLTTGAYNVQREDGARLVDNLPAVEVGPAYAQTAVERVLPAYGASFIALSVFCFAFTTIVAYYYMAETNVKYINRHEHRSWAMIALKLGVMGAVGYGTVRSATTAWALGDIGVGIMAWLNIIAILLLHKPALLALRDYEHQRKAGQEPQFDPERLGIKGADHWTGASVKR